jgi:glycosyltransferase involved in cell wall biosynthesis
LAKKAIVVPCFNEAARLDGDAFLRHASDTQRFVFVDDGSTDGTAQVLAALAAKSPHCEVVSLARNSGKAEAVRQGLLHALGAAELVGYFDADLATPLDELAAMETYFADPMVVAVTGARVQLSGTDIERHRFRHYTGRIFATAAALTLGAPFYDTQCGAKLFRVTPVLGEALAAPFHSAWFFDVELIGRLLGSGVVREHPLRQWRDVGGSKVKATTFVRAPFELARLSVELGRWRRLRRGGPASSS